MRLAMIFGRDCFSYGFARTVEADDESERCVELDGLAADIIEGADSIVQILATTKRFDFLILTQGWRVCQSLLQSSCQSRSYWQNWVALKPVYLHLQALLALTSIDNGSKYLHLGQRQSLAHFVS
jgi:hypothetical protein